MKSANDACVALAEQMAGSEQVFVQNMNLQACLLGCADTNFCNSNGLPAENHYSSAYDLALMTRAAMQNEIFASIVQQQQYMVRWIDGRRLFGAQHQPAFAGVSGRYRRKDRHYQ